MKIGIVALLILSSVPVNAHEFRGGYSRTKVCSETVYKEQYVPGTPSSPGYIKSWQETIERPCYRTSRHHHHRYYGQKHYQPLSSYRVSKLNNQRNVCSSGKATTGGLLGGGLAALLSKKDAYAWSIPIGAVVGMGVANSDC